MRSAVTPLLQSKTMAYKVKQRWRLLQRQSFHPSSVFPFLLPSILSFLLLSLRPFPILSSSVNPPFCPPVIPSVPSSLLSTLPFVPVVSSVFPPSLHFSFPSSLPSFFPRSSLLALFRLSHLPFSVHPPFSSRPSFHLFSPSILLVPIVSPSPISLFLLSILHPSVPPFVIPLSVLPPPFTLLSSLPHHFLPTFVSSSLPSAASSHSLRQTIRSLIPCIGHGQTPEFGLSALDLSVDNLQ